MKTFLAISMTVLALALVACGDDSDDNPSSQATNTQATTPTTKTATTEDKEKPEKKDDDSKKSSSSSEKKRSSSSSGSSSKPKTTNSGQGDPITADPDRNENAGKSKQLYTKKEAADLSSQLIAKRVCQGFLPKQTERDLEAGRTTKEKVAAQYAKGWPESKQKVARRGCLQGLNARDK
jgi:hypothetical protein